ncbi:MULTISPECIES: hypothetical protein [Paenibacillus]|uniref:hypothetical protein n=1 Tax=Paenibacillus TaxID=44249 RepID=UPI001FE884F6|nr:hypothetical protein [Paenibacillus amylolyticus]
MKITLEMSKMAYQIAKKVYSEQLTRNEGKIQINRKTGMNEGSAQAFITIFFAMMNGEVYKRAFNNETNRFLFESIKRDFGKKYFIHALNASQLHVNYYSTLRKGNLSGLQNIINEMNLVIMKDQNMEKNSVDRTNMIGGNQVTATSADMDKRSIH